jgi:hypothetical protein
MDSNQANAVTADSYIDVFRLLEHFNVPYVVIGGLAGMLHGPNRSVADLDIVVSSSPADQNRAQQTLMMAGFAPTIPVPLNLLTVMRMFDQSQREIDVFVRYLVARIGCALQSRTRLLCAQAVCK